MAVLALGSADTEATALLTNDVILIPVFNDWDSVALLIRTWTRVSRPPRALLSSFSWTTARSPGRKAFRSTSR